MVLGWMVRLLEVRRHHKLVGVLKKKQPDKHGKTSERPVALALNKDVIVC